MANTTSESFLSGRGIIVEPRSIESKLDELWGSAAEEIGGPEIDHPSVTRVVLANLVAAGAVDDGVWIDDVLDTVVARYPCRTIVLKHSEDLERKINAEVSALCHLPAPGRPQVCSERIVLWAGPRSRDLLPGAVRPLLEPDLPFVLWWNGDPRDNERLFKSLASECSRLILSLPDPLEDPTALEVGLDPTLYPYGHDLSWFGATLWRGLIAQFFDARNNAPGSIASNQYISRPCRRVRIGRIASPSGLHLGWPANSIGSPHRRSWTARGAFRPRLSRSVVEIERRGRAST